LTGWAKIGANPRRLFTDSKTVEDGAGQKSRIEVLRAVDYNMAKLTMKISRLFQVLFCFTLVLTIAAGCRSVHPGKISVNVRDLGAKGDGTTKDTVVFQAALDLCATNGGGTVSVPAGAYLIGSIVVGPNTTLQLQSGAKLSGSPDIADYPLVTVRWEGEFRQGHRALISSENAHNVTITGPGAITGPPLSLSQLRNPRGPVLIELANGTNVTLNGFSTQYQRLWSIHLLFCRNVTVRDLVIRTPALSNGDGIDVDSCSTVTIKHCDINTGDDAISLKSGRGLAAMQLGRPTQNVLIRNCTLASSLDAGLGIGTEMSGGIRDVRLENCTLSGHQNGIFIKSRDGRGGFMENITGENLTISNSPTLVGIDLVTKGIQATDPVPGDVEKWALVKNISFNHVAVNNVQALVVGTSVSTNRPIDGLTLADITGNCGRGITLANVVNAKFEGINVTGFSGALFTTNNVQLVP
jgi:polygalacturonase